MTRRPAGPAGRSHSPSAASPSCASTAVTSKRSGNKLKTAGSTTISCSPPPSGTPLDSANVRRGFRRIATAAGLDAQQWTPRELRHSFVSILSDEGVPIEQIARLVGHAGGSTVTEKVYRKQLRPVVDDGATVMDRVFGNGAGRYSYPTRQPARRGHSPPARS